MKTCKKYVLLDDEGQVVRYFDYPAEGTLEVKEKQLSYDEMLEQLGECLV